MLILFCNIMLFMDKFIYYRFGTKLACVYSTIRSTEPKNNIHESREEKNMGRMRENPRYNVISMRISDEEREHLETIMGKTKKSISDIMREAIEYFSANYDHYDPQGKAA